MRHRGETRAPRWVAASLAMLGLVVTLAGCSTDSGNGTSTSSSSSTSSSTSTNTAMSEACASAATLKSSLQALTTINPLRDGQAAVTSAITKVKTDLDAAVASASGALKPEVDGVKTAVDQMQTAASGLT